MFSHSLDGKTRSTRDIDCALLVIIGLNVLGALLLGHWHDQLALAAQVSAALAGVILLGALPALGRLRSRLLLSAVLTVLVALQIHLARGALQYHFNVFVSLSLLLVYRDWRPIATMASLFIAHHVGFDRLLQAGIGTYCLSAPDPLQIALHAAFVVAQGGVLSAVAMRMQAESLVARELEFLVNAMGREGRIRLNLDVVRAETPLGQRLHHVQARMAEAIRAVQDASRQVDAAAQDVAEGSGALMSLTESTASGLKDSAMCLQQIGVIVQHSTEASGEARAMSVTAAGMADQGDQMVTGVVATMKEIEAASRRITDIIGVIDGIAFQTNILALNAAVEAARAGEQGRGFAVVASEVRSLAQRSATAAKEIKSLIGISSTTIETGTRLVGGAGKTMNQLVSSVRRVGELFESVTADTAEQMQGLQTVSASITELSGATEQNVGVAERASAAAAAMREQSARLAEVLNAFNLGEPAAARDGGAMRPATSAALPRPRPALTATAKDSAGVVEFF